MGLFDSLFGKNHKNQQSNEIARVSELLQNEDYRSIGYEIATPIQIQSSQQNQAAKLYLEALKNDR